MLLLGGFLTVTTSLTAASGQPVMTDLFVPGSLAIFICYLDSLFVFNLRGFALAGVTEEGVGEVI